MRELLKEKAESFLNAEDQPLRHVLLGAGLVVGVAMLAHALAGQGARIVDERHLRKGPRGRSLMEAPRNPAAVVAPALLSATTLSALRVWNSPKGPERSRALGLWFVLEAVTAVWMALRPRRLFGQIGAAMVTAGVTAAYAFHARPLDKRAATLMAPNSGSMVALANPDPKGQQTSSATPHTLH
ncbi:TspO protein [Brevundimonas sp. 2R-24]|uniref:TspO protein n=1 Tax=Peiella sedimenti TaxID=3061083 RepID=A0ABT8SP44_9CAUL|nr:TspO protein [Caulobacteraceae bacterium XZ-24]